MDTFVDGKAVGKQRWIGNLCIPQMAAVVALAQADLDIAFEFTPDCIAAKRLVR